MKVVISLINFALLLTFIHGYIREPGPRVIATRGEIWPKPQNQTKSEDFFVIRPQEFDMTLTSHEGCRFLKDSLLRYQNIINLHYVGLEKRMKSDNRAHQKKKWKLDGNFLGYLDNLQVNLKGKCEETEYPGRGMDEKYELDVLSDPATLTAQTVWGILRGLESFSQSIYIGVDLASLRINKTSIVDYPRFEHRGLLVDTSRHFIPVNYLLANLDAMAYNKLNIFHWHIVDDESFPYVSKKFPELSELGAFVPWQIYTVAQIKIVIEYARERGIRVIPEFDTPGHTRSWGVAFPELLTECYSSGVKTGQLGPMDPTKNFTYEFLRELFEEVRDLFSDQYIHLGGDEVGFECWQSNENITNFMKEKNMTQYEELESYYIQQLVDIIDDLKSNTIVWEEVFLNNVTLSQDTIVQVWTDWTNYTRTLEQVTATGRGALLSSCWYLDHLETGGDWKKYYECEPFENFAGDDKQKKLILGGETCMWSEVVNQYNFLSRVWPRASAAAERLWSDQNVLYSDFTERRMEEHACRMNSRGISAQPPNSAGYCL